MPETNILEKNIEALLFWKGEPISISKIATLLKTDEDKVKVALVSLEASLANRGIRLIKKEDEVALATSPETSELIEALAREELVRDLGKAGLETLSIILYQGPVVRSEIDYIRGVNSQFILRNLLVRGLIEKITDPKDQRRFLYKPTIELLAHLGISKIEDLPEYFKVKEDIESYKNSNNPAEIPSVVNNSEVPPEVNDAASEEIDDSNE